MAALFVSSLRAAIPAAVAFGVTLPRLRRPFASGVCVPLSPGNLTMSLPVAMPRAWGIGRLTRDCIWRALATGNNSVSPLLRVYDSPTNDGTRVVSIDIFRAVQVRWLLWGSVVASIGAVYAGMGEARDGVWGVWRCGPM